MKISSKPILSPARAGARDPQISLSTSLSRRFRTSGSIKGGASPAMFPTTTGKKRGCGFENPEPSSPKVTCIGQVRVKSRKKQGKKLRALSRRHSTGEVSFKKLQHSRDGFCSQSQNQLKSQNLGSSHNQDQNQECSQVQRNNNQRWVHFPLTICEALRAFGSEFSCLFPCRTPCLQDGGGGGGGEREIELVVAEENEDEDEEEISVRNSRRHVFEDLEIVNGRIEGGKDEARVSICVPPKNALLLMRCRSDPVKMETLANRNWEPNVGKSQEEEEEEYADDEDEIEEKRVDSKEPQEDLEVEKQKVEKVTVFDEDNDQEHDNVPQDDEVHQEKQETDLEMEIKLSIEEEEEEEESMFLGSLFEEIEAQEEEIGAEESTVEKVKDVEEQDGGEMVTEFTERSENPEETDEEEVITESEEGENGVLERESEVKEERESMEKVLPDCLLLMMCEPKLSMEVSKETWVCRTDFIRRHSDKKKPPAVRSTQEKSKVSITTTTTTLNVMEAAAAARHQPARSSCSLPVPPSMAVTLEQKLVNAVGYEPFELTRCKSEPMRTAAAKLVPETCFWENRKVERLSRATFGVGAAGLGF